MPLVLRQMALLVLVAGCSAICVNPIYCQGPLLDRIQMAGIYPDSKTFVDMPMKVPADQIMAAFQALPDNASNADLLNFTTTYFNPSGYEVRSVVPSDWEANATFLQRVADPTLRAWALAVHGKWRNLVRIFDQSSSCGAACFSSIQVPHPFVVAGGRFNEYYYWDSFWIVEGLLVSGMVNTTRNFIANFLYLVQTFGFVPNGGRVYYLDRSQPPVLIQLVRRYVEETNDLEFLAQALPILDMEYQYWEQIHTVTLKDAAGETYRLSNYNSTNELPRPESYLNDVTTAQAVPVDSRAALYGEIATGAETGWDFSSRWFADGYNLSTIQAKSIIPVDLNSILYANEVAMAGFHHSAGNATLACYYEAQAKARRHAMKKFLWNKALNMWTDYNHVNGSSSTAFYPSNFTPIWANATHLTDAEIAALLQQHGTYWNYVAGMPTSLVNTTQQWDFPNAWAPLQFWIIEALLSQSKTAATALSLIQRWITTNYCAWNNTGGNVTGIMFEKYNALDVGQPGQGGEYAVQDGFGWTNGVVLRYLSLFGGVLELPSVCPTGSLSSYYVDGHQEHVPVSIAAADVHEEL